MIEKEFNLLREPWILVIRQNGVTEEVSILDLFRNAHQFKGLAGELITQDIAILRLLLAILHAVFSRYDTGGNLSVPSTPDEVLKRWEELWNMNKFPMGILQEYLLEFEDRFYLFHPKYPFYQVPGIGKSTEYQAAKLNGALSESNNKLRLFPQRGGNQKNRLTFAESARWIIYVNSFDDTSSKSTERGMPSPGAGWLGKLGLIFAVGNSLFETLLLNLCMLKDGGNELWGKETPVWELSNIKADERTEIIMPDNLSSLYTLQSRRLLLKREKDEVTGFQLLGGDFFPKANAFSEQMTVWRKDKEQLNQQPEYQPKRHNPARQLWRDLSSLVVNSETIRRPGVVSWLALLKDRGLLEEPHLIFQTASVKYGDKDFFVDDVFGDSIRFNAALLQRLRVGWVNVIKNEIEMTDKLTEQLGWLAQNLAKAAGNSNGDVARNEAKEQAYYRLDEPFRQWLERIDPIKDEDQKEGKLGDWWKEACNIVRELGDDLVAQTGPNAFTGREIIEKINGKEEKRRYTAPEAYNQFIYRISHRESL